MIVDGLLSNLHSKELGGPNLFFSIRLCIVTFFFSYLIVAVTQWFMYSIFKDIKMALYSSNSILFMLIYTFYTADVAIRNELIPKPLVTDHSRHRNNHMSIWAIPACIISYFLSSVSTINPYFYNIHYSEFFLPFLVFILNLELFNIYFQEALKKRIKNLIMKDIEY